MARQIVRASSSSAHSKRAANCSARSTRRLSSAKVWGSTTRRRRAARSSRPWNGSRYSPVSGSQRDRVDGEVAPARGVGDAHRRIAVDLEAGVPTAGFRLAARQGDVDRPELEHREGAAHRLDPADRGEQSRQRVLGHTEDFEVEVLGVASEQAIADVAADDQRPAATSPRRPRRPRSPAPAAPRRRRRWTDRSPRHRTPHGDVCQNQPVMTTVDRAAARSRRHRFREPDPGARRGRRGGRGDAAGAGVRGDRRARRDPGSGAGTAQRRGHARRTPIRTLADALRPPRHGWCGRHDDAVHARGA